MANRDELEKLRDLVRDADLTEQEAFSRMLRQVADGLSLLPSDIADALRVSRPTVSRWLNGVTAPHVGMREPVRSFAIRRIDVAQEMCEARAKVTASSGAIPWGEPILG